MTRFEGTLSRDYYLVPQSVVGYHELEHCLAQKIAEQFIQPRVVEIGVGTGITTQAIVASNPGCLVKGVDNELAMLDQAKTSLRDLLGTGSIELHLADALDYLATLDDASVDVVASSFTLHNCLRTYRIQLEKHVVRILRPGGMFINNDKYAADDRDDYVRELALQMIRYDVLAANGRDDLRRLWIEHEIVDQLPERIMWTSESLSQLRSAGFVRTSLSARIGQYAVLTAYKPNGS